MRLALATNVRFSCDGHTSERACAGEAAQVEARCAVLDSQRFRAGLNCAAPTALDELRWPGEEEFQIENFKFQIESKQSRSTAPRVRRRAVERIGRATTVGVTRGCIGEVC